MVANGERKHTPTVEDPAILLLADEFASLVYSAPDNKAKAAVEQDLKRCLSVGRACRVNIYALAQDPRADSILARSLFTQALGLRFRDVDSARLALGASVVDGARRVISSRRISKAPGMQLVKAARLSASAPTGAAMT